MIDWGKLHRSDRRIVAGVCGGIAEAASLPPLLVRAIALIVMVIGAGVPLLVYLVLYLVMPTAKDDYSAYVDVSPIEQRERATGKPQRPIPPEGVEAVAGENAPKSRKVPDANEPGAAYAAAYSSSFDSDSKRLRRIPWYIWPVLTLVAIAVVLGLINGLTQFYPLSSLRNLWPLAVIFGGACIIMSVGGKEKVSITRVIAGVDVIILGVVLLLCSTGVLGWASLISIWLLWPAFFIALGIAILSTVRRSRIGGVIAMVLVACTICLGIINYATSANILGPKHGPTAKGTAVLMDGTPGREDVFDLRGSEAMSSTLTVSSEQVVITGGESNGVTTRSTDRMGVLYRYSANDDFRAYTLLNPRSSTRYAVSDVVFSDYLIWNEFEVYAIASDVTLDLTEIDATEIFVQSKTGALHLILGDPGTSVRTVRINGQMAGIQVDVPAGCAVVLKVDGRLMSLNASEAFEHVRGTDRWVTRSYSDAVRDSGGYWVIEVDASFSDVSFDVIGADANGDAKTAEDAGGFADSDASSGTEETDAGKDSSEPPVYEDWQEA